MLTATWSPCPGIMSEGGYAHAMRDGCTSCAPFWEMVPACPCGGALHKSGKTRCRKCRRFVFVDRAHAETARESFRDAFAKRADHAPTFAPEPVAPPPAVARYTVVETGSDTDGPRWVIYDGSPADDVIVGRFYSEHVARQAAREAQLMRDAKSEVSRA